MTDFFQDLLDDLREKRLLPVALVLLLGLVAVPVLLMKSDGGEAADDVSAGAVPAPAGGPKAAVVDAVGNDSAQDSDLGVFDPKNPFKSDVKVKKPTAADGVAQLVNPPAATPASPAPSGTDVPDGKPGPTDFVPPGAGQNKLKGTSTPPVVRRQTKLYTYVVDVKFGQTGDERLRKGVKRLGILPNDRNPVVVFLGVSADVKRAVFLVDSRVSQSGEGACRPSVKSCTFLYLRDRPDRDEQFLTDEKGREYHLTLLDIRRVEVKKSSAKASAKASRRSVTTAGGKTRSVQFPALAPEVRR